MNVIDLLDRCPDGLSAAQICMALHGSCTESDKRELRKVMATLKPQVVSAPGLNYRLLKHCDADFVSHAANSLRSQARSMQEQAEEMESAYALYLQPQLFAITGT